MFIRWSEHPYESSFTPNSNYLDDNNEAWIGLNRIELASVFIEQEEGLFKKLMNPAEINRIKRYWKGSDFNFDPFKLGTQTGLHTIDLNELEE